MNKTPRTDQTTQDLATARLIQDYQRRERRADIWQEIKWTLCDVAFMALAILIMVILMLASK